MPDSSRRENAGTHSDALPGRRVKSYLGGELSASWQPDTQGDRLQEAVLKEDAGATFGGYFGDRTEPPKLNERTGLISLSES